MHLIIQLDRTLLKMWYYCMNSSVEEFYADWLAELEASVLMAEAYAEIENDPSADDFSYFRSLRRRRRIEYS